MPQNLKEKSSQEDVIFSIKNAMALEAIVDLTDNLNYMYGIEKAVSNYDAAINKKGELNLLEYQNGEKVDYLGEISPQLMKYIIKGLKKNQDIVSLTVPGENLSQNAKVLLGDHLANSGSLKHIDLGGAINNDMSAAIFGTSLSRTGGSLQSVDISGSKLTESSAKRFAEFLHRNEPLKLKARGTDNGIVSMIESISGKTVQTYTKNNKRPAEVTWAESITEGNGTKTARKKGGFG
ncbi:MAG: hypothetical protein O2970_12000 [Proteobacteria bacterium]|nr:hypothetical protein [Pseudomonadota bacterium]MDA0967659.1 hypothetical protein [Pseudomonadota bacterium]MDG4544496.1 hypothetical protein [Rickettsiales bacterium]MDG4548783.1 hypothetical protein [Rickettsiales bacterium]